MIDGYEAPADLAAARRRVSAAAEVHRRRLGLQPDQAVVTLTARLDRHRRDVTAATAVVVADMVLWRWDDGELQELAALLGDDAIVVFLEPTADLGWRRLVHRIARVPTRLMLGHHFQSDVPARLRAAGLIVTTTDRFGLGPAGLGSYVWGVASGPAPVGS